MAVSRWVFSNIGRNGGGKLVTTIWRRLITSGASSSYAVGKPRTETVDASSNSSNNESLKRRILGLKSPTETATTVLQNWTDSGNKVDNSEFRLISNILLKSRRYNQALEILTWKETQKGLHMSAADHSSKMKLLIKLGDSAAAEEHFNRLPTFALRGGVGFHLLHGYVLERNIEKAEALMSKLTGLGLTLSPHPFTEMMKLYMATSKYNKVLLVIEEMTRNKIPKNVLYYNFWMDACAQLSGAEEAEAIYAEMLRDDNVKVGWSTLSTLANIYIKKGLVQKAVVALKAAEAKLSARDPLGYRFLITQYATLNNKVEVLRLWEASKGVGARMTCANYMCILSCLVKVGDLFQAEKVFMEWESNCKNYDVRVSNVLLGAYMRTGRVDEAESLHFRSLEKGGRPNYKTWEILMEGWLRSNNMVKAINAMKKGLEMLKDCHWRPSQRLLVAFVECFEKLGNLEDSNNFIRDLYHAGLTSSPIYKSLLRIRLSAKKPVHDILEMMEKDKLEMDDEISTLVQAFSTSE